MLLRLLISSLIIMPFSILPPNLFGQEASIGSRFQVVLDKIERSRSSVATACFSIREVNLTSFSPAPQKLQLSDRKKLDTFIQRRWSVVADFHNDRFLLSFFGDSVFPDMGMPGAATYILSGPSAFRMNRSGEFAEVNFSSVPFTNPHVYGLGFCNIIRQFKSLPEILANVREWESREIKLLNSRKGSVEEFSLPLWGTERDQIHLEVNVDRGYMPVKLEAWHSLDNPIVRAQMSLEKKSGVWLPSTVSYICSEDQFVLRQFEWHMVNEPIPEGFFIPAAVSQLHRSKNPLVLFQDRLKDGN